MSPSLRCRSLWWWPLVHLCSFRCRLLDGSHYTRPTYVVQIKTTQTPPKPLQTLAFVGVSQPPHSDTKTTAPRHDVSHVQDDAATAWHGGHDRPGHDGSDAQGHDEHGRDRIQRTDGHGGHGAAVITATTPRPQARRPCTAMHDGRRRDTATIVHSHITRNHGIQRNVPARYHTTRNTSTEQTFQRCICNKPLGRGGSPGRKKQGRWLSSADAECSLEHFWITRYSRSLHIFSGCNRCCTLHIVYNVPWIDVDGSEASLSHINVWPSTHTGGVSGRPTIRPVYPGRGLYGLVPIIFWAGRQFPPGVALASVALGSTPKGCSFASLCIAAIAAVCKTATFDTTVVRVHHGALGFTEVAARETDGIARNVLHGTCGGQETPCLNQVVDDRRGGTAKRGA